MTKVVEQLIKRLKNTNLSIEDRTAIVTALLEKSSVLPLKDSIVITSDSIKINDKPLDMEQILNFRESAIVLKDNFARSVIRSQIRYLATNLGIYKSVTLDELMFYKSALWNLQQEDDLLDRII